MPKRRKARWKNSTDWSDAFLRKMLSWVCKEIEYPRLKLRKIEFGNRTNCAYSGRAWSCRDILVRVGPDSKFPCQARIHGDGFTVGTINDRLEALVKVTAHEVAHLDNARRGNSSRRAGEWGGSERYTDVAAKRVLMAFREKRAELEAAWAANDKPKAVRAKKPKTQVRAENAFAKVAEWERKLKLAKTKLKQWQKKARYYEKNYPNGEYPTDAKRKPGKLGAEALLRRKISRYITIGVEHHGAKSCKLYFKTFGEGDRFTRQPNEEWAGYEATSREARAGAELGDVLEVSAYDRRDDYLMYQFEIGIPESETILDACLKAVRLMDSFKDQAATGTK